MLNLGSGGERGPYLVTQTGVSPNDSLAKERMFVLRPDGRWVDFNAYACQGKPEALDEVVFSTTAEVMETFTKLFGRPQVLDLPIDEVGLKAWIERQKSGNPLEAARAWAVGYQRATARSVAAGSDPIIWARRFPRRTIAPPTSNRPVLNRARRFAAGGITCFLR